MSSCPMTAMVLDQALAADHPGRAEAAGHAASCDTCTRALERVRTFDSALLQATRSFVSLPTIELNIGGGAVTRRPLVPRVPAAAIVGIGMILLVVGGGFWTPLRGWLAGQEAISGPSAAPSATANRFTVGLFLGVRPEDVLVTEDGGLAVTYDAPELALNLVRVVEGQLEKLTLATIEVEIEGGRSLFAGTAVACPDELGLVRSRYIFGYSQGPARRGEVTLDGLIAIGGEAGNGTHLFALAPRPIHANSAWKITTTNGIETGSGRFLNELLSSGVATAAGCRMHR